MNEQNDPQSQPVDSEPLFHGALRFEPPPPPKNRGLGCLILLLLLLAGFGLAGMVLVFVQQPSSGRDLIETYVSGDLKAERKLVQIELRGAMLDGGSALRKGVTRNTLAMLDAALEDPAVAGVMLTIDSPGGSVTDAELIHQRIERLRAKRKPVVVQMGDICASGGYYVACAANEIVALPTTVTGSIGVLVQSINVSRFLDEHGVSDVSIASGKHKMMMSATRPVNEESAALLQEVVDELFARFVDLIVEGRNLDREKLLEIADGRLLTATKAREAGLIDAIGYPEEALNRLRDKAEGQSFKVVRYEEPASLLDWTHFFPMSQSNPLIQMFAAPRPMVLYGPIALPASAPLWP